MPFSHAEARRDSTRCDVLVMGVELDRVDLDLWLPFREEMRDVDVGVGDQLDSECRKNYSYSLVMGGRSLSLPSPSKVFIEKLYIAYAFKSSNITP